MITLVIALLGGALGANGDIVVTSTRCQVTLGDEGRQGVIGLVDRESGRDYGMPAGTLYELQTKDVMFLTSNDAKSVTRTPLDHGVRLDFTHENGAVVHIRIEAEKGSPFVLFRGGFTLPEAMRIDMFRFPLIRVPEDFGGKPEEQVVLSPQAGGYLARNPRAQNFQWSEQMYPGYASLQLTTLYDATGGVYLAAHDDTGHVKAIGVSRPQKTDFQVSSRAHFPLTPRAGTTWLPYPVAVTTYKGDWHDAADLYKSWATQQWWCKEKWVDRKEVPQWLKNSPVVAGFFLADREHDGWWGPVKEVKSPDYITNALQAGAERFEAPIVAWFLDWEKNGAWRGADYLPPMMGWEKFDDLQRRMYTEGMKGSINFSAYYWVYEWSEEPGEPPILSTKDMMVDQFGDVLCLNEDGSWYEREVSGWQVTSGVRHTAKLCRTPEKTKQFLLGMAETMMDHGWDMIHFDQENCGGANETFCASTVHGHEPGYGDYIWKDFADLLKRCKAAGRARDMDVCVSIEEPQELFIPALDTFQIRNFYTKIDYGPYTEAIPLFSYVYHEYSVGFCSKIGWGAAPGYRYQEVARAAVAGNIPGIAFEQVPPTGSEDEYAGIFDFVASWHKARSTFAQDFLAFGNMGKPLDLHVPLDTRLITKGTRDPWPDGRRMHIPSVANTTWTAPDGRWGAVIASGASEPMACRISASDLPNKQGFVLQSHRGATPLSLEDGELRFTAEPKTVYLLCADDGKKPQQQ